ncbi:MAG: hypothetical protein H7326_08780 [Bdellovibrionaceae bacterium]|nr:hypothetical protein [Pseudobdellovibrionaceae bacterium]
MKSTVPKIALYVMIVAGCMSCTGANLYKDLAANKTSDEALYEDAKKLLDAGNYTGAIAKIQSTSAAFQSQARVKESLGGAYAARCGMEFLPFVTRLTGNAVGSFFSLAANGFVGVTTANYADCVTAENIVEGIGTISARTQSQNIFLMILEMAKIGNMLRKDGDVLPTPLGDGTTDAGFNCRSSVPIADAKAVMESFFKFLTLFTQVGATLSGSNVTVINNFVASPAGAAILTQPFDYSGGSDPTGPDEFDPVIIISRSMINSQTFGIGSCNNPDPTQCICP